MGANQADEQRSSSTPSPENAPNAASNAPSIAPSDPAPSAAPDPSDPPPASRLPPPSLHVDVAVAGGGLAGLALAVGLQSRGIRCAVLEASPTLRSNNSTVMVIWPNGAAALEGILPGLSGSVMGFGTVVNRRRFWKRSKPSPPHPPGGTGGSGGEVGGAEGNDAGESGAGGSGAEAGGAEGNDVGKSDSGGSGVGAGKSGASGGGAGGSSGTLGPDWVTAETDEAGLNMVPWRRIQGALAASLPRPDLVRCGHRVVAYHPVLKAQEGGKSEEIEVEAVDVVCEVAGSNPGRDGIEYGGEGKQLVVVRAKVLVGADGVRSAVRNQMIEDSPRFLNQIAWNSFLSCPDSDASEKRNPPSEVGEPRSRQLVPESAAQIEEVPELTALIDEVTGCSAIFITLKNGERFWQVRLVDYKMDPTLENTPYAGVGSSSKQGIKARLLPLIHSNLPLHPLWERALQSAESTQENQIFERRQLDRPPPKDSWSDALCGNRVVLIGDAAHAMDPGPGQGALTGFEDAHQLCLCLGEVRESLAEPAAVAAAVRDFEARRIGRCVKVHAHATGLIGFGEEGREFKSRSRETGEFKATGEFMRWMFAYPDKIQGDPDSTFFQ